MRLDKSTVETFLRVSIFVCVIAFCLMLALLIFDVGGWAMWLSPIVACAGVIISFGINLNKLQGTTGVPDAAGTVMPEGDGTPPAMG
ncbi:hypothetical protein [Pseudomonas faucium]|uniref:hypothetical protein n=1 Tax=Pseudomonas faucium TaxID=2740518 RepID=UPI0039C01952